MNTLYIMATFGLVMITNRSSLFKPLRERISWKHQMDSKNLKWWFLDSIFGCALCMGVWAAGFNYVLLWLGVIPVLQILAAAGITAFLGSLLQLIDRR